MQFGPHAGSLSEDVGAKLGISETVCWNFAINSITVHVGVLLLVCLLIWPRHMVMHVPCNTIHMQSKLMAAACFVYVSAFVYLPVHQPLFQYVWDIMQS